MWFWGLLVTYETERETESPRQSSKLRVTGQSLEFRQSDSRKHTPNTVLHKLLEKFCQFRELVSGHIGLLYRIEHMQNHFFLIYCAKSHFK